MIELTIVIAAVVSFGVAYGLCVASIYEHDLSGMYSGRLTNFPLVVGGPMIWIAILIAFFTASLAGGVRVSLDLLAVLACGTGAVIVGRYDDIYSLHWSTKLGALTLISLPAVAVLDVSAFAQTLGFHGVAPWIELMISLAWIVCVTNAINLIDGLDGLASIQVIAIAIILGALAPTFTLVVLAVAIVGACTAFLRFNLPDAKIYLGDAGSLSLGLMIAVLSVEVSASQPGFVRGASVLLLLGLPLFEVTLSIVRRLAEGRHPFSADSDHIHHRILILFGNKKAVALSALGLIVMSLAVLALSINYVPWLAETITLCVAMIGLASVVVLGYVGWGAPTKSAKKF